VPSRARVHDVLRIAAALLAVVAITYQLARLQEHPSFGGAANFFSFFTIQSNMLATVALVLAALVRRDERSLGFDAARTAATFYVVITGVVFAALLSGLQEQLDTHNPFANSVLHYVIPAAAAIDWLVDPPRHRLGTPVALAWLVYPVAWFAYTLARGSAVGWYPYPFVDVARNGYGGVLLNGVVFLAAFALGALALARVAAWRTGRSEPVAVPSAHAGG
jgi:carbon starvation protein CstA